MSERLDAPALRAVVLLSAVPFRVQIKRVVESRDRERGRKERGGGWCEETAGGTFAHRVQDPAFHTQTGTKQTAANQAMKVLGCLPNSLRCCSPLRGSCRKVNPEPRWGCACSGRALTRQSQRCLLCSPPSIFPVGEHRELIMGSTNGLFIKNACRFSLRFKLFTYRMWVNSRVPSRSKFASFVSTSLWLISRGHKLEAGYVDTLPIAPSDIRPCYWGTETDQVIYLFLLPRRRVTCSIYYWVSGMRKPHTECNSFLLFIFDLAFSLLKLEGRSLLALLCYQSSPLKDLLLLML